MLCALRRRRIFMAQSVTVHGSEQLQIVYQSIPLGYRMWTKEVSKLEFAANMVRTVMPELEHKHQVLLLFQICSFIVKS